MRRCELTRATKRKRRASLTSEELAKEREKKRIREKKRQDALTPEQAAERREKGRIRMRNWRAANPEEAKARHRKYNSRRVKAKLGGSRYEGQGRKVDVRRPEDVHHPLSCGEKVVGSATRPLLRT